MCACLWWQDLTSTYSTLLRKCLGPYLFPHPPQSWNIESESVWKEKTGLQLCLSARCSQTVWKQVEGWALLWLGLSWTSVNGVAAMRRKYFFVLTYPFFFFFCLACLLICNLRLLVSSIKMVRWQNSFIIPLICATPLKLVRICERNLWTVCYNLCCLDADFNFVILSHYLQYF